MISPKRLAAMQGQWVRLLDGFGVPVAEAYAPFDRLVAAYSEPPRHYHTLEHLGELFRVVGRLAGVITDMPPVQFAVWYHDAVYDPKATDNEERSADWAEADLKSWSVADGTRATVRALILATKHTADVPATPDAAAFLDADLAILGAAEARYARYAADIRKEYDWVPGDQYRAGRRAVLEGILNRERIFRTAVMFDEGEGAARRNLTAEIERLSFPRT